MLEFPVFWGEIFSYDRITFADLGQGHPSLLYLSVLVSTLKLGMQLAQTAVPRVLVFTSVAAGDSQCLL